MKSSDGNGCVQSKPSMGLMSPQHGRKNGAIVSISATMSIRLRKVIMPDARYMVMFDYRSIVETQPGPAVYGRMLTCH